MASKIIQWLWIVFIILYIRCEKCDSASILGIFHLPSKSHHILGSKLLKSLAENGHQVTMVSPFRLDNKVANYTDIILEEMLEFKTKFMQQTMVHNNTFIEHVKMGFKGLDKMCDIVLNNPKVKALENQHFDLVIQIATLSDSFLGLAHRLKAPVIYFHTKGSNLMVNDITGNPAPLSYIPTINFSVPSQMTFWQRVLNTLFYLFYQFLVSPAFNYYQQQLSSRYFPEAPPLAALKDNISLVFVNSHFSIESPRPHVPNMVQIGGFHIEKPKELEPELRKYLDSASEGAILFSFGSNVLISTIDKEKLDAMLKSLGKLPYKVLFKSEIEIPDLPKNLRVGKWLPQNDILAHPNLRLFISHGGLLSTTEAVYHGVPILGVPFFDDQEMNIACAAIDGYAVRLKMKDLTEESFTNALSEISGDTKYEDTIKLKSKLLRHQPIPPLDLAIFWVQHVLKYGNGDHLKNEGTRLYLYQYLLIDVFAFFGLTLFVLFWIIFLVTKLCVRKAKSISLKNYVKVKIN